ncbi:leucine-rich repeat domain-containing protein [Brachyspira pilosicoli]|uniref:leucine-rich repeat domain-containing protein n=1 Tax=Brachyspira pilosicoli TaxID=52584 RepID=UPI0012F49F3F|nr:leucine-rich repeat domain-containing protein [Brachyspira pilosicoli]
MYKKIVLMILCFLVAISCSNPNSPNTTNTNQTGDTNKVETVTPPGELEKYGVDISQDDDVIASQLESNLKLYFDEKGSYKVILKGIPKDYDFGFTKAKSLAYLIFNAANTVGANSVDVDISNIDFKNNAVSSFMFLGGDLVKIPLNFIFPIYKIKTIDSYAFFLLYAIKEINIPNSVNTIGAYAFQSCLNLEKIIFGDNLETIGDGAFIYCQSLKELTIPSSLKSIGNNAFDSASSLTTLTYLGKTPDDITTKGSGIFDNCTSLTTLIVPNATNPNDEKWKTFLGGKFTIVKQQ